MKVQDAMLQALGKKINWWQAAEILGVSDRHMRRWRERYVEQGYNRLLDRRRGQANFHANILPPLKERTRHGA
jgi:hypothetical protein